MSVQVQDSTFQILESRFQIEDLIFQIPDLTFQNRNYSPTCPSVRAYREHDRPLSVQLTSNMRFHVTALQLPLSE